MAYAVLTLVCQGVEVSMNLVTQYHCVLVARLIHCVVCDTIVKFACGVAYLLIVFGKQCWLEEQLCCCLMSDGVCTWILVAVIAL